MDQFVNTVAGAAPSRWCAETRRLVVKHSDDLRAVLTETIAEERALAEIAARSYLHPNGFLKIVLGTALTGAKVRLHFWSGASAASEDADLHDHRWHFVSRVLFGQLTEHRFEPNREGLSLHCATCHPQHNGVVTTSAHGKLALSPTETRIWRQGDIYHCDAGIFHQLMPEGKAATLVVTSPPLAGAARVISFVRERPDKLPVTFVTAEQLRYVFGVITRNM